mgnify:CR=1 FL=1
MIFVTIIGLLLGDSLLFSTIANIAWIVKMIENNK